MKKEAPYDNLYMRRLVFTLGLDVSNSDQISMRFGSNPPPLDERSLNDNALEWHSKAKPVEEVSDGVKAFRGILCELLAGDPNTFLIDEPEAFLHPSLAFRLGKEIASSSIEGGKQVFAATHSPQFLFGAIQSGVPINIIRLTYLTGNATARLLPNNSVRALMKDPLLRSSNVLAGLFHDSVIVTEADTDRAFYQEINERLLDQGDSRGIDNPLFINANGKDQLHRIASPLRELGVPTATIADIDVLNQGGSNWTNHLSAYGIPDQQHQPLGTQRSNVWDNLSQAGNPKENGLGLLDGQNLEAAKNLFETLKEYGFFIVPVGELERWLADLHVSRSKHVWLREIFNAMGDDPNDDQYQKPDNDPIWSFIGDLKYWLKDAGRKGVRK
ncbi:AAA family ATPase [Yoonia sp. 2307UL14-13]